MRKILLSLVKNEEDIIEQFVRHHGQLFDTLIIADDASTDGTPDILASLQTEGLPLTTVRIDVQGHQQSKKTTALYASHARLFADGDLVCLLDADEFVDAEFSKFVPLSEIDYYSLPRIDYLMPVGHWGTPHVRFGMAHRRAREASPKAAFIHREGNVELIRVGEGNHKVWLGDRAPPPTRISHAIHHYPYRTREQIIRKAVLGWPSMLLHSEGIASQDQPVAAHWKRAYQALLDRDFDVADDEILALAYGDDKIATIKSTAAKCGGQPPIATRYDGLKQHRSTLGLVLREYEKTISTLWKERQRAREE